jgi:hypothetical protein
MPFEFHGVMKDAADPDDAGNHRMVEQQMARLPDEAAYSARSVFAVAKVIAADRWAEFWPVGAVRAIGLVCDTRHGDVSPLQGGGA